MRRGWMYAIAGLVGLPLAGLPQMRVVVNVPAYRIDVYIADSVARSMPIAVGRSNFRTPRGEFAITSIEWNPWWIPPDSPWAADERPTGPGPGNPMGRVKLNFRPLYFLHGTPVESSIGSAASHGCIRMANTDAIELARLVHQFGSPAMTPDDIEALVQDTVRTRTIHLEQPVPLDVRYDLVELRAGRLTVYRDIYWLATRPLRAEIYDVLAANGVDTTMVDSARLATLVRRIGTNGNSIAIDSLVPGGVSPVPAPPGMSLRRQDARSTRSVKSESLYCRGAP